MKDYDAAEPSRAGYMMARAVGVVFVVAAATMLLSSLR
nr:DUF6199 family natural product biosynthesis protein [Streptomyces albidochromogenes]